ncbi:MAG TPA: T9SS type A sorting domain-containing protein [Saprospiraceae bacterium]|nr:T9SS type A sorting domain-containing protein [Saprospiraceae bacterium]HNM54655.1 T9SS type A sorting domain-containing protein [Saprospiraceae bacterium]
MKSITSLSKVLTSLLFLFISTSLDAQIQVCSPDTDLPVFSDCPTRQVYDITDPDACGIVVNWTPPTASDLCIRTNMLATNFNRFFTYYDEGASGANGQYILHNTDSFTVVGVTNGIGPRVFQVCFFATCNGTLSFHYRARMNNGDGFIGDRARVMLQNANTPKNITNILTPGNGNQASGNMTLNVDYGDRVCFEVQSDNFLGVDSLTISQLIFSSLTTDVFQVFGPRSGDVLTPGTYNVEYGAYDCAGNLARCDFNVIVNAAPHHILDNCSGDQTILIQNPADCDTLLDYLIPTIKTNCPTIKGMTGVLYPSARSSLKFPVIFKSGPNTDQVGGTDGYASVSAAGDLTLIGTSNGTPPDLITLKLDTSKIIAEIIIPCDGTVSFDWNAMMRRFLATFFYDEAGYEYYDPITQTVTKHVLSGPPFGNFASGSVTINVLRNSAITFFVNSANLGERDTFQVKNFVFTPDPIVLNQTCGPDLSQPVVPGVYQLCYNATDCFGSTEECSFNLTVKNDYPLACKDINVSLDANCQTLITPLMLLAGGGCPSTMKVELSHYGKSINNPVNNDYLNKHIIGKVTDTLNGYSCWSNILIEDKLAPIAVCRADTIDCLHYEQNGPLNYSSFDCSRYTVTTVGERTEHLTCDSNFLKIVYRDIKITDETGNETDCTDTVFVTRIKAGDFIMPGGQFEIECSLLQYYKFGQDFIHPIFTGIPYVVIDGHAILAYPESRFLPCNLRVTYEDVDFGEINCVRKVMRTWTVREWWCNTEIVRNSTQLIIVTDQNGPVITHHPYDFKATTVSNGCYANVNLPSIEATDMCHDKLRVDVVYPGGFLQNKNGGLVSLPVGEDTIIYRVYDACYNVTEDTIIVTVADETEPIAICDRRTVVSLNGSGENWVPAEVFDDGSFDECHLHHMEVRRMDRDYCGYVGEGVWAKEAPFCCGDVGKTIMVALRVYDQSGNYAVCMVMVEVQDKDKPRIIAPPDIEVDCRFPYDMTRLGNSFGRVVTEESDRDTIVIDPRYWHYIDGHPFDGIAYDNCSPNVIETIDTSGMNQCGMGILVRKFVVYDGFGNRDSAYQRIYIANHHPMTELSINWPDDFDTVNICDPRQLRPELLEQPYKFPTFYDDECSLVGVDYEDHIFSATVPGDPCYKIFREWKVIDWCYRNEVNDIVIFRDTQIIKVNNTVDPVFTEACRDTTICTYDVNCSPIPVTLRVAATDFCTAGSELLYRYKIDFNGDGTFDVNHAEVGNPVASGTWPLGRHIIKWEVEDRCGNTATCHSELNLINCKPPTAYAHRDLSIGLTGMDTDGDGVPDTKMATVWASDLNAGSNHSCGYYITFSFSRDTNDKFRVYTCDSIGPRNVELWVTDINGNTSFVKTVIIVNDNRNQLPLCPQNIRAKVAGLVRSTNQEKIEQVEVELVNSGLAKTVTNYEGEYTFGEMNTGGSYTIHPERNDEWLNGVSTADIVKIQKHILGKELLGTGYLMMAADVNNSKTITSADISELRKLILGITTQVKNNTSWRFVNASYTFSSVENALQENIPEEYTIQNLNNDIHGDFIGVKVGDLTNNAKTRGFGDKIETRSRQVLDLNVENISLHKNEVSEIVFSSGNVGDFNGMQGTLSIDPQFGEIIEVTGNKEQHIGEENFNVQHMGEGKIAMSWNSDQAKAEEWLFTIRVRSKVDAKAVEIIQLNSSITQALSIDRSGEEGSIMLRGKNSLGNDFMVLQNEPNPWKQSTTLGLILPYKGEVNLTIYDLTGRVVYKSSRQLEKGYNGWNMNRSELPGSGVYYYQVDFETNSKTNKMVVVD